MRKRRRKGWSRARKGGRKGGRESE